MVQAEGNMTRYVNRWTAQAVWIGLMAIVGLAFVPNAITIVNFLMFTVVGSAVLVTAAALFAAHQPAVSASQARVQVDAAEAAAGRRR